jgi:hypothetical protein
LRSIRLRVIGSTSDSTDLLAWVCPELLAFLQIVTNTQGFERPEAIVDAWKQGAPGSPVNQPGYPERIPYQRFFALALVFEPPVPW